MSEVNENDSDKDSLLTFVAATENGTRIQFDLVTAPSFGTALYMMNTTDGEDGEEGDARFVASFSREFSDETVAAIVAAIASGCTPAGGTMEHLVI